MCCSPVVHEHILESQPRPIHLPSPPTPRHLTHRSQPSQVQSTHLSPSHPTRTEKKEKGKRGKKEKGKKEKGKKRGGEKRFLRRGFLFRSTFIKTRKPLKRFRVYPIFRACGAPPSQEGGAGGGAPQGRFFEQAVRNISDKARWASFIQ